MHTYPLLIILLSFVVLNQAQSPDYLYDELFEDVQLARVLPDSKTFCDAVPKVGIPDDILDAYRRVKVEPNFNLTAFVYENFKLPESDPIVHDKWTIEEHCNRLWSYLTRTTKQERFSSFIDVPSQFVVPGGRFREFYYWDTYFTMLGLVRSNQLGLITNMLDNFAYLINQIGLIPNGNRNYYQERSQPPFFVLMTELVNQTEKYRAALQKEYQFWMDKRSVTLDDGTVLNRYYDDRGPDPRPEAYFEDTETYHKRNDSNVYLHLRAAAESGWDFSSRWMDDETDLSTIVAADILPVDLNSLLYHLERVLGKTNEANRRRDAIRKYMWSAEKQFFTDYNYVRKARTDKLTLAGLFPLWLDVSTVDESNATAAQVENLFLRPGGLVTTLSTRSIQQWDSPNGWAPLQFVAYRALLKTPGYESLAKTIRQRWMKLNERVFSNTGKMMEKYDVVNIDKPAGGGEYETQDGFGWTNGVYLEMLHDQKADPTSNCNTFQGNSPIIFISFLLTLFFVSFM